MQKSLLVLMGEVHELSLQVKRTHYLSDSKKLASLEKSVGTKPATMKIADCAILV